MIGAARIDALSSRNNLKDITRFATGIGTIYQKILEISASYSRLIITSAWNPYWKRFNIGTS